MHRILFVTNEPNRIGTLAKQCRKAQLGVVVCEEVEAAEALMAHFDFDVVVTELSLAPLWGLEGLKLIRHVATHYPSALLLAISGQTGADLCKMVEEAGDCELWKSPWNVELIERIFDASARHCALPLVPDSSMPVDVLPTIETFIENCSLSPLFQPIIDLQSSLSEILGFEALVRPTQSLWLWTPDLLFSYAEKKEVVFETDLKCIEAAIKEYKRIMDRGKLFLNVRPLSFIHPLFAAAMVSQLHREHVSPQAVVLELTEQQSITNPQAFDSTLQILREQGFQIAIDDFGVGFANLQLVQDIRPDYIKLSGVFCSSLTEDSAKHVIVRNITKMAKELSIPLILESVETKEQAKAARRLHIPYAQGYYFARPKPASSYAQGLSEDAKAHT